VQKIKKEIKPVKFLIQRVNKASVNIDNKLAGKIEKGLLIFVGICDNDTEEIADKMLKKTCSLRIFSDNDGKTNLSLSDVNGQLMIVSQFTLYANCKKGNRPSFFDAGSPEHAEKLYNYIIDKAHGYCPVVETGSFGAEMAVSLENDGPFTIMLNSDGL